MEFRFTGSITKGDDKQFPTCQAFPLAYEVEVDVLEGCSWVSIVDLGHDSIGVQ